MTTIIDEVTGLAIMKSDLKKRAAVSLDINLSFIAPGNLGKTLQCLAECTKIGKNVAFASAEIYDKETGKLLVQGRHTMHFIDQPFIQ